MRAFVLAVLVGAATSGCSVLGIDRGAEAGLEDQRRAWVAQNQRNYTYEYERLCFCVDVRAVIITVKNDVVTSVVVKETGEPVTQYPELYMTITKLYDYLIDAADRADEMDVRFDDTWHIPSSATIDFIRNAADDELRLNVRNLVLTGP
jgi:hypothetical protein